MHRYGLYALQWIIEVNGKLTPDLDAFVNVTKVFPQPSLPLLSLSLSLSTYMLSMCGCARVPVVVMLENLTMPP